MFRRDDDTSFEDNADYPTVFFNSSSVGFGDACDAVSLCDIDWCNAPSTQLSDSFRGVSMLLDRELVTHRHTKTTPSLSALPSSPKDMQNDDVFIPVYTTKNVPLASSPNDNKRRASSSSLSSRTVPSSSARDKLSSSSSSLFPSESSPLCPVKPARLVQTHVKLCLPPASSFASLLRALQDLLESCADFDFRFDERAMHWRGKYLCGKKRCLVMLHLYRDLERSSGFVLEAVKTKGDATVFHELFRQLAETLNESVYAVSIGDSSSQDGYASLSNKKPMRFACMSVPLSLSLSLDELLAHLESIDEMASCEFLESRLCAAQLLCDLASIDGALLAERAVVEKIIQIVETLLFSPSLPLPLPDEGSMGRDLLALFEEEEEHLVAEIAEQALIALSLLCAATPVFQETLLVPLHRETLRVVAMMVSDAPSETAFLRAQLRRECALLLLSLAHFDAAVCVKQLQDSLSDSVQTWLETLSDLRDAKLRDHGMSLQNKLLAVM